jgi:hypothetical protein
MWGPMLWLACGLAAVASASGWAERQDGPDMAAVRSLSKASRTRVTAPELAVPLGTAGHHLRTRGEWIKRSYGEHSDAHHPQQYGGGGASAPYSRRRAQEVTRVLTLANTAPLKIAVDFSGMYNEATDQAPSFAQPYTGCFAQGDWFKWNYPETASPPCRNTCATCIAAGGGSCDADCSFPGSTAPCGGSEGVDPRTFSSTNPDGVLCNRQYDPSAQDCWGVCLEEDVITEEKRAFMRTAVESVVTEVEGLFRVRRRAGNMVLANSKGVYSRLYETMDVDTAAECAKDARVMYRMPVSDSYCTAGVDADVVFMPFMSQHVPNVAGFGGDAGKDQYGRPVMITMGWGLGGWGTAAGQQNLRDTARAVIMHELVHGLGFNIFVFQNTYDFNGRSRPIVRQMPATDIDGSTDSGVWHAIGKRVVAVSRAYFQCSAADWPGFSLPLMGENPLGDTSRGSHWETRIMKDEFLAYGGGDIVSAFTLAMMEDLGHYIGDYSKVSQMSWGRGQGCSFVAWRCGDRNNDFETPNLGVSITSNAECAAAHPYYDATGPLALQLNRKCERPPGIGTQRCAEIDWVGDHNGVCNSECVDDPATTLPSDHPTLLIPPIADGIPAAGPKDVAEGPQSSGTSLAMLGFGGATFLMFLLALFVSWFLHVHHYQQILNLSMCISFIFLFFGLGLAGFCIYMLSNFEVVGKFISRGLVVAGLFIGLFIFFFALLGLWGASRTHKRGTKAVLSIFFGMLFAMVVVELILVFSMVMWVDEVSKASADTGEQFGTSIVADSSSTADDEGDGGGIVDEVVTEVEGFACRTYKSCCWTPAANQTTCTQTHSGSSVGSAAAAQQDPSAPSFCYQVTGSSASDDEAAGAPEGLCQSLAESSVDGKAVLDLAECKAEFCDAGVEGFETFVITLIKWARSELTPLAIVLGSFIVLQMGQLVLSGRLLALAHYFHAEVEDLHKQHAERSQEMIRKQKARVANLKGGKGLRGGVNAANDKTRVGVVQQQAEGSKAEAADEGQGGLVIGVWRAQFEYTADGSAAVEEGELPDLSFKKGDEIHVTDNEGDWWSGWNASSPGGGGGGSSSRGVVGQFPANYLEPEPLSRETGAGAGADHQGQGQQQKALASTLSLESVGGLESPRLLPPLEHTPRQPSPAAPAP